MPNAYYYRLSLLKQPRKKLSKAQAGRLGGLAAADALTPLQRSLRSSHAGSTTKANHARDYYVRLAMKRWGYDVKPGAKVGE